MNNFWKLVMIVSAGIFFAIAFVWMMNSTTEDSYAKHNTEEDFAKQCFANKGDLYKKYIATSGSVEENKIICLKGQEIYTLKQ